MNRWITSIGIVCLTLCPAAAFAQGGYTVMNSAPQAPPPGPGTIAVVAPAPSAQAPMAQITPLGPGGDGRVDRAIIARRPEEYGGVTPGAPAVPPGFRRARRPGPAMVAWPGFQMVPGGSRVFVVLTSAQPVVEGVRGPRTRVFHIEGARIHLSNNRRPLITEAFETPVSRAFLRPARGGVDLVVELRGDVEPTLTQDDNAQGYRFVYVNFPTYSIPEVARIQLPNGVTVVATPQGAPTSAPGMMGAPPPAVVVGAPRPGSDAERPPGIR